MASSAYSAALCSRCHVELSDHDFQNDNFIMNESGSSHSIQHKKCPSDVQVNKPKVSSSGNNTTSSSNNSGGVAVIDICKKAIISQQSQYTYSSVGSCTINALETALRLQLGQSPSVELIDAVLIIASLYTSSMHSGVSDILPKISRYHDVLQCIHWQQYKVQNIHFVTRKLQSLTASTAHDVSCIITKPPETIFVHRYSNDGDDEYVLYDSHPRPQQELNGAHFLIFADLELLNEYLRALFPFVELGAGYGLYGDMMNQCEAHFVQLDYAKLQQDNASGVSQLRQRILEATDYTEIQQQLNSIGDSLHDSFISNQQQQQKQQHMVKNPMEKIKNMVDKASQKIHDIFAEEKEEEKEKEKEREKEEEKQCQQQASGDAAAAEQSINETVHKTDEHVVTEQTHAVAVADAGLGDNDAEKISSVADESPAHDESKPKPKPKPKPEQGHDQKSQETAVENKQDVIHAKNACEYDGTTQQKLTSMSSLHSQKSDEFVMVVDPDTNNCNVVIDDFITVEHDTEKNDSCVSLEAPAAASGNETPKDTVKTNVPVEQ